MHKGYGLRNQASWQRFDAKCGSNFNRVFLNISTHHSEMFEGTRFWKEVSYISFRLLRADNQVSLTLVSAGAIRNNWVYPSVIPFQSKWNSLSSLIWGKMLFSILIEIIERAFSVFWYIKYTIPSVYFQTYSAKYFIEDFKWASPYLLPTNPKLFITAWHIRVVAEGQILIKQSFQRFFSPLSGRNSELI